MSHIDVSKEVFAKCTHINVYIIACLQAENALDELQVSQLSGEKSLIKRSHMIFDWIKKSQALYDIFLRVMEQNEQQHVSNLLKGIKDGMHIPLSHSRYNRLVSIKPKLMLTIINDEELVANLRAKHAISEIDRQDITQEKKEYKRNYNLIEAILRRSDYAFDCFEQALRETLQDNVASYLHEGEIIAVHANTTHPEKDEVISQLLNATILSESRDDTSSEEKILTTINGYNIHPVVAKAGQSIVFFLYCKTIDNMITFTELFISGDLQSIVEVLLNRILSKNYPTHTEHLKAKLSLDEAEILAVEKFCGIEDWMSIELKKSTKESIVFQNVATQTKHEREEIQFVSVKELLESKMLQSAATSKASTSTISSGYSSQKTSRTPLHCKSDIGIYESEDFTALKDFTSKSGCRDELPERYKSDPVLVHTIIINTTEEEKKWIRGLTILNKEMYVVSHESSEVEVYDSMKFSFSRRWKLEGLIDPKDISSCNRNKCIYIFDYKGRRKSNEILRVDPNGKLIRNWSTGDDFGSSLSVTDESNVMLTVIKKNKLNEYSPNGQLIREIIFSLDTGIFNPRHAVKMTSGHFVVIDNNRICIVNRYGNLTKSFDGLRRCTIGQIIYPAHLAVDGNGYVMVADLNNSLVLLFDSDLKFKREILSQGKRGLRCPSRILLDESNNRMFVADNEGTVDRIMIYTLNK